MLDDYLAHNRDYQIAAAANEIRELLELCPENEDLEEAVDSLGGALLPPGGQSYAQWSNYLPSG